MATTIVTAGDFDTNDFGCRSGLVAINWDNMDCAAVLACLDTDNNGKIDGSFVPDSVLSYLGGTGILTLTNPDGSASSVNLPLENFLASASFDSGTNDLTLTLDDGTTVVVPLDDLLDTYVLQVTDSDNVDLTLTGDGSTATPWDLTADVIIDPNVNNIITTSATGLLVDGSALTAGITATGTDTDCIDITVSGDGQVATPLTISAAPVIDPNVSNILSCGVAGLLVDSSAIVHSITATGTDTNCMDVTVGGDGTAATPLTVQVDPIIDPNVNNALACGATGLLVDETALDVSINAAVVDTDCIDLTLTGDGTAAAPLTITASPIVDPNVNNALVCGATGLLVDETALDVSISSVATDTSCIDMTITGDGTAASPLTVSAAPIVDPNTNNVLSCGATGLIVDWNDVEAAVIADTFDCSALPTLP